MIDEIIESLLDGRPHRLDEIADFVKLYTRYSKTPVQVCLTFLEEYGFVGHFDDSLGRKWFLYKKTIEGLKQIQEAEKP